MDCVGHEISRDSNGRKQEANAPDVSRRGHAADQNAIHTMAKILLDENQT